MLIGIVGPTASGKSSIGEYLIKNKNVSIINADSRQLMTGLSYLKAVPEDLAEHYLYQCCDTLISVISWVDLVKNALNLIEAKNRLPVLIGGTGFYFKVLQDGLVLLPKYDRLIDHYSFDEVKALLLQKDPLVLFKFQDEFRLRRALFVLLNTGKSILTYFASSRTKFIAQRLKLIALMPEKNILWDNISFRIERDFANMVDEVRLFDEERSDVIGVKEIKMFLLGQINEQTCKELIFLKTRQYAKRQKTYIRNCLKIERHFKDVQEIKQYLDINIQS